MMARKQSVRLLKIFFEEVSWSQRFLEILSWRIVLVFQIKKQRKHLQNRKQNLLCKLKESNQATYENYIEAEKEEELKALNLSLEESFQLCLPTPLTVASLSRANTQADNMTVNQPHGHLRKNKVGPILEGSNEGKTLNTVSGTLDSRYFQHNEP